MAKAKVKARQLWRNRKIETKRMRVGDVLPHPMNPKIHGENQLAPLRGLLETVGKLDDLKAYYSERNSGKLTFFDGHGRMSLDPSEEWDVDIYDLNDAEADLAVATFDPIAYEAQVSRDRIDALLREVDTGNASLQELISGIGQAAGIVPPDNREEFAGFNAVKGESEKDDKGREISSLDAEPVLKFPLGVVVSAQIKREWEIYKQENSLTSDSQAFIHLWQQQ